MTFCDTAGSTSPGTASTTACPSTRLPGSAFYDQETPGSIALLHT